jgi:hypothetical protein
VLASALPFRCFPVVRRQLQHPCHTVDPSVSPFATKYFADAASAPLSGEYLRDEYRKIICVITTHGKVDGESYSFAKNHIGMPEREVLVLWYR